MILEFVVSFKKADRDIQKASFEVFERIKLKKLFKFKLRKCVYKACVKRYYW